MLRIRPKIWQMQIPPLKHKPTNEINLELANADNPFRIRVQEKHLTVKVKEAKVTSMEVKTKHDFSWAGWNDANIDHIVFDVAFIWDGILHKDGKTTMQIKMKPQNGQVISVEVTQTDAAINLGDKEAWQKINKEITSLFAPGKTN